MKITHTIVIYLNFISIALMGQGKIIDVAACDNWERIEEINGKSCLLSSAATFAMFKTYSENRGGETVLKNLILGTEQKFSSTYNEGSFDGNNMFAFQMPGDSLVIFDARSDNYTYLSRIKKYFIIKSDEKDFVAYFKGTVEEMTLTIWDIKADKKIELLNVRPGKYWLNKQGTVLLTDGSKGLVYTNLHNLKSTLVTSEVNVENAAISYNGKEIVYVLREASGYKMKYFDMHSATSSILLCDSSKFLRDKWKLEPNGLSFDSDDGVLFKVFRSPKYYENQQDSVITRDVNIWSYQDLYLQPKQRSLSSLDLAFTFVINVRNRRVLQIESEELSLELQGNTSKYFILTTRVNENEFYWNKQKKSMFLVSKSTGNRTLIKESPYPGFRFLGISPDNRFLLWFDGVDGNYYCYDITNGKTLNISRTADGDLRMQKQRHEAAALIHNATPYEGQYWINNCNSLVVNSKNDIWLLDPLGVKAPVNLTNGYGALNNIRFRFVVTEGSFLGFNSKEFLAWAFDNQSKQNGFWKIDITKSEYPIKLVMSDDAYFFYPLSTIVSANSSEDPTRFEPLKASKKNMFIVRKMNSAEAANLYYTTDFKKMKRLTNIVPNKNYGRISTKMIKWKLPDGQSAEGILHKPEMFDSTQKYPIIFNYYEQRSECLNVFRTPELSGHNINIPWYVSRGYLIFEPDFYYSRGKTSISVINSVESALVELRKLPFIDQNRMGAQGQSHGGYETNVLATGTHLFAAASEMAGFTNLISEYGSIRPGGYNNQSSVDVGQRNLGVFPWNRPDVFIENSPVFQVSKMSTPLLMVHNEDDGAVLFSQAIELYLSLRRLGKEVWLLQYDNEGHELVERSNKLDYTIRMQQFFDHYLKGGPMPIWMSNGIPAPLKGIVSGLRYEKPLVESHK